ncbi:MAG: signal peptidase I [Nitrososphaerales archaeon]|jgi:signal peptidase I
MESRTRRILLVLGAALLLTLLALPFIAGTSTYPIAIVQGNSMYPKLQNGELVFFTAPRGPIQNGTVIVFVQGGTGVGSLDSLLKPVVIHRVVSVGQEPSGVADYQTKGDNNLAADPFVTDASSVLGVPAVTIPYVGLPILFLQTPYGMVAAISLVCFFFLSSVDTKMEGEDEKKRLIAVFARYSLNGTISQSQFERLRLSVEFFDEMPIDLLQDPTIVSVIDWLREGSLETDWKEEQLPCPTCGAASFRIVSGSKFFLVCPRCSDRRPPIKRVA